MKWFFFVLVMITLQNIAKADTASTINTVGLDKVELETIKTATDLQIKSLSICLNDEGVSTVVDTACINEVFGDVY